MLRRLLAPALLALSLLAGACAAPTPGPESAVPADGTPVAAAPATPTPRRAPPMSTGLPPDRLDEQPRGGQSVVDRTCRTDADCTVKDVGSCCGAMPACVNVDSPTDPAGVKAHCAESGMASTCGFQSISACQCVKGECAAASSMIR